jgi:hypothetical protein
MQRFAAKFAVAPASGCFIWLGGKTSSGYGSFKVCGKPMGAHRYAYALMRGRIPAGFEIDHMCGNRACVRPAHLQAVTRAQNERFKVTRDRTHHETNKTHCPQGHPYAGENLYVRPSGKRGCWSCNRARQSKLYYERRQVDHWAVMAWDESSPCF